MVILWQSVTCILLKKTSFEVRFEAFLTGRRVAVFWKNGMKNFFNFWAKWVHYPNGIKIPRGPKKGRLLVYRLQQKWHKSRFGRKVE